MTSPQPGGRKHWEKKAERRKKRNVKRHQASDCAVDHDAVLEESEQTGLDGGRKIMSRMSSLSLSTDK